MVFTTESHKQSTTFIIITAINHFIVPIGRLWRRWYDLCFARWPLEWVVTRGRVSEPTAASGPRLAIRSIISDGLYFCYTYGFVRKCNDFCELAFRQSLLSYNKIVDQILLVDMDLSAIFTIHLSFDCFSLQTIQNHNFLFPSVSTFNFRRAESFAFCSHLQILRVEELLLFYDEPDFISCFTRLKNYTSKWYPILRFKYVLVTLHWLQSKHN